MDTSVCLLKNPSQVKAVCHIEVKRPSEPRRITVPTEEVQMTCIAWHMIVDKDGASTTGIEPRHYTTLVKWVFTRKSYDHLIIQVLSLQQKLIFTHSTILL